MTHMKLTEGPSKFDFVTSLFHSNGEHPCPVKFTFELDGIAAQAEVLIASAEREDGSGENWLFKAYLVKLIFPNSGPLGTLHRFQPISKLFEGERSVHGYFDMRRRKGWIAPGYEFPVPETAAAA